MAGRDRRFLVVPVLVAVLAAVVVIAVVVAGVVGALVARPDSAAAPRGIAAPSTPSTSPRPVGSASPAPSSSESGRPSRQRWLTDVADVLQGGTQYLEAHRGVRRPAIVLDIDNTALQSYYFGGAATPPVLAFEQAAVRAGYSVLFATGRPASSTGSVKSLTKAGYRVDALCKRATTKVELQVSKARCRANWTKAGYTIVADVGNHTTDFIGGNTGKVYSLPNYGFLS